MIKVMYLSRMLRRVLIILIFYQLTASYSSLHFGSAEVSSVGRNYSAEEVLDKSPVELLKLRGFRSEVHFARTKDGYYVNVVRIINPKINKPLKRPVVFNHGLLESATIWLINSRNVEPIDLNSCDQIPEDPQAYNGTLYLNGPMMLSNLGYDVWLMSMRGTEYSLHNDFLLPSDEDFWDYSLDDFALGDVPTVIDYVRKKTRATKVGYIGHSQATFSIFGLLATRPRYADIIEPVIAVAPVAYLGNMKLIDKLTFIGVAALSTGRNGPFPPNAKSIRSFETALCHEGIADGICKIVKTLMAGVGEKWPSGYFSHIPFFSSWKVLRHASQLIKGQEFSHYDHGADENIRRYGQTEAPLYSISRIRSKSLCFIRSETDTISVAKDVDQFISELSVPIYREIFINGDHDHLDLITGKQVAKKVFKSILGILETVENETGVCAKQEVNLRNEDHEDIVSLALIEA